MSGRCPVCDGPMPDLPTDVPLTACSQSCESVLAAAARRFLHAVADTDTDDQP